MVGRGIKKKGTPPEKGGGNSRKTNSNNKKKNNMENLKNIKRTRATEVASSEEYARATISAIIEKYNIERSGYYTKHKSECECGECQCVRYAIDHCGFLTVDFCEVCGEDGAPTESYINVNC